MTTLLELKEKLVHFYGKNEVYITPIIRFLLAFASFLMINRQYRLYGENQHDANRADFGPLCVLFCR